MSILDSRETIKSIDESNVLGSIDALPQQCEHAWEEASKVDVPENYRQHNAVVFSGMGGSALAGRIIETVYPEELKVPLVRVTDYHLPNFVNQNTLVFCSSYSGATEETVSTTQEAIAKQAKWLALASGGQLIDLAKQANVPYYQIEPKHNPSNQPRMAVGYSLVGHLVLAAKAGLLDLAKEDIDQAVEAMKAVQTTSTEEVTQDSNPAKTLATDLKDRIVVLIAAQHLVGPLHTVNNQFNENAKVFTADHMVPELNHHLMEGLKRPESNPNNLAFVFIDSDLYSSRIQQRMAITKNVLEKHGLPFYSYKLASKEKLSQAFELIQFGAYTNFYLSMIYGQNPTPIPWVDYFKNELGQPLH